MARGRSGNDHGGLCVIVIVIPHSTAAARAQRAAAAGRRSRHQPLNQFLTDRLYFFIKHLIINCLSATCYVQERDTLRYGCTKYYLHTSPLEH